MSGLTLALAALVLFSAWGWYEGKEMKSSFVVGLCSIITLVSGIIFSIHLVSLFVLL